MTHIESDLGRKKLTFWMDGTTIEEQFPQLARLAVERDADGIAAWFAQHELEFRVPPSLRTDEIRVTEDGDYVPLTTEWVQRLRRSPLQAGGDPSSGK